MSQKQQVMDDLESESLEMARSELEAQLADATRQREKLMDGAFDHDLANATVRISQALAAIHAEKRQARKQERLRLEELTPELVLERLGQFTPSERAHVLREAAKFDEEERNVLG